MKKDGMKITLYTLYSTTFVIYLEKGKWCRTETGNIPVHLDVSTTPWGTAEADLWQTERRCQPLGSCGKPSPRTHTTIIKNIILVNQTNLVVIFKIKFRNIVKELSFAMTLFHKNQKINWFGATNFVWKVTYQVVYLDNTGKLLHTF